MNSSLSIREWIALLILVIGTCVVVGQMAARISTSVEDNRRIFMTDTRTWANYREMRAPWRPRVLSNVSANLCARAAGLITDHPERRLKIAVALHTMTWFLLVQSVFVIVWGRRSLPWVWGVFTAVSFGYTPGMDDRVFPWDLPGLLVFSVFVVLVERGWMAWLPLLIMIGTPFKETCVVLCIAPLFFDGSWPLRIRRTLLCCAVFAGVKIVVDLLVGLPVPILSMSADAPDTQQFRLWGNLREFVRPRLVTPWLVNAGSLAALLLLPVRDRIGMLLKVLALLFSINLLVFGQIMEFRIWFEMAPIALYGLTRHFYSLDQAESQPRTCSS